MCGETTCKKKERETLLVARINPQLPLRVAVRPRTKSAETNLWPDVMRGRCAHWPDLIESTRLGLADAEDNMKRADVASIVLLLGDLIACFDGAAGPA